MADFFKGTFTGQAGTGDQTVTGIGFTPVALLVWSTGQSAAGVTDGFEYVEGWTDGTRQVTFSGISVDNSASSAARRAQSSVRLIDVYNSGGTVTARATIVSFGSGQFTINWSTALSGVIYHFVAIGGAGVEAYVAIGGNGNVPAVPFTPDVIFANHGAGANYDLATTTLLNSLNFGWMTRNPDGTTFGQGLSYIGCDNAGAAANTSRYQRTNMCLALGSGTGAAVTYQYSWSLIGMMVEVASTTELASAFLCLKGVKAKAGTFNQKTSTGTQATTGVGFLPKCLFLMSVGQTPQTTLQTEARLSRGAASGAGAQGHSWIGDLDAADPTVNARRHSETTLVSMMTPNATGSSSSVEAEADLDSFDADGFTLDWTTADATAREILFLALGDAAPAAGGERSTTFIGMC